MEKVNVTDDHWIWNGSTRPCSSRWPKGHGMIQRKEGVNCKIYAHRAAWILFRGPIPEGKMVLHICPSGSCPHCVNPDHLEIGDGHRNMQQMTAEGSNRFSKVSYGCKGELHGNAKLTWAIVQQIRSEFTGQRGQQRLLCAKFGVAENSMSKILRNVQWVEPVTEVTP